MPETLRNDGLPNSAEELVCFVIYSASHALNRAYGPMLEN